jgi:hypothetical protein
MDSEEVIGLLLLGIAVSVLIFVFAAVGLG